VIVASFDVFLGIMFMVSCRTITVTWGQRSTFTHWFKWTSYLTAKQTFSHQNFITYSFLSY